jgi:hypothetical protein
LKIEFYDRDYPQDDPAFVTYNPPTLHIDNKTWADGGAGEGYARFVLAHEAGHLLLHDNSAKAFSQDKTAQIGFAENGHSAEWQANTFAGHFLLPSSVVQQINDFQLIMIRCNVTERLALERVIAVKREETRINRVFGGGYCGECGNFSLRRDGWLVKCDICGSTTGFFAARHL